MSLLNDPDLRDGRRRCGVAELLDACEPALDRDDVIELLNAPTRAVTHIAAARVLNKYGFNISARIIERHRTGRCSCH